MFPTTPRPHLTIALSLVLGASAFSSPAHAQEEAPSRPNIVIMFTDDQAYGDLGCYGAEGYETPHIDRLAAEGARFTDFYVSSPVCSASRAALLTGCYHERVGIQGALAKTPHGLHPDEDTIADLAKRQGYATIALGKWHLGRPAHLLPPAQGFDEYLGIPYSNDMWPFHPNVLHLPMEERVKRCARPLPLIEGTEVIIDGMTPEDQAGLTTRLTERAVDFIGEHKDTPFFLYLANPQPHVPLFVSDKFAGKTERGLFGDVISEIDWSMGQIMGALEEHGLGENTLIIFTCDNGAWLSYGTHCGTTGGLREGKGTCWEGGVRVPMVARWPRTIPPGTVVTEMAGTIDILPTVARAIGADLPDRPIDGKDITPLLAGEEGAKSPHDALFFYYKGNELQAMRSGDWKLILPHKYRSLEGRVGTDDGIPIAYNNGVEAGLELYNLSEDRAETTDLAEAHPEVVAELMKKVEEMRADLGDRLTKTAGGGRREPGR